MKKLAVIAAAAMLVFGFVGQAAAFFEDFNLIRSIYTTTGTKEVGSDLGADVRSFAVAPYDTTWPGQPAKAGKAKPGPVPSPFNPVELYAGSLIPLSAFDGPLNSLQIGYWAHGAVDRDFWATGWLTTAYGGTDNDGLTMLGKKQGAADANYDATQSFYAAAAASTGIFNKETGSYFNKFDASGLNVGSMGNVLDTNSIEMTLSLAALSTVGYVDQLLYWFDYDNSGGSKAGVEVAVIRTFLTSDGATIDLSGDSIATVVNPSAVPIPGSVLLLASGLLGIFGFRRKRA